LKNAIYRALTQLEGYELRSQDILLPDFDAATLPVGEDAMEGSLMRSPAALNARCDTTLSQFPQHA
jgi:transcriptional regulator of aromatic amino acid metabolism